LRMLFVSKMLWRGIYSKVKGFGKVEHLETSVVTASTSAIKNNQQDLMD